MRDFPEIVETSNQHPAFSSKSAMRAWKGKWCNRCQHPAEVAWRRRIEDGRHPEFPAGCTVHEVAAFAGVTPAELTPDGVDNYRCSEFVGLRIVGGDE